MKQIFIEQVLNLTGGDYQNSQTYRDWESGDLTDKIKSVRLTYLVTRDYVEGARIPCPVEQVQVLNTPESIQDFANILFGDIVHNGRNLGRFYNSEQLVAQCNHTYILKSIQNTIHVNFFTSDVLEERKFNTYFL